MTGIDTFINFFPLLRTDFFKPPAFMYAYVNMVFIVVCYANRSMRLFISSMPGALIYCTSNYWTDLTLIILYTGDNGMSSSRWLHTREIHNRRNNGITPPTKIPPKLWSKQSVVWCALPMPSHSDSLACGGVVLGPQNQECRKMPQIEPRISWHWTQKMTVSWW